MSLSAILVPIAIGAVVTGTLGKVPVEVKEDFPHLDDLHKQKGVSETQQFYKIETKIKDQSILQEALQNYGSEIENNETFVDSVVGSTAITFALEDNGLYSAVFADSINEESAHEFVRNITEEYTNIVQKKVYDKLMSRAEEEGLIFESEENREDSVVLTFGVKE